jgi:DNA gyrase subunit B
MEPALIDLSGSNLYTEASISHLKDAEHIRQRPGMYIGDTSANGLHHLVFELVHNSVDEALAGYCKNIHVTVDIDGSITVSDDGRGIPVEPHSKLGKPTLEIVLTISGTSGKFDRNSYKTPVGLHGIGAKAVTALSEYVEAEVRRNGRTYAMEFERGKAITELMERGASTRTGTSIRFLPDAEIFHDREFKYERLETHLRELAYLNKGLTIKLSDRRINKDDTFHAAGGISEFVEYINRNDEKLHAPIHIEKMVQVEKTVLEEVVVDDIKVEVAFQYTTSEGERIACYANNAHNSQGGTHLTGFRTALTRTMGAYGQRENLFKNATPTGVDFTDGLTAVISVYLPEPLFESQTKVRLTNPEVSGIVQSVVNEQLAQFLEQNPKEAKKILSKIALAAEAREAARKAKDAIIDRKKILGGGGLPGKLMDCSTKNREESELFLVEGQSAGGSAESGRDRHFQAILPLRGKVLNVEKARPEKFLGNEEICNLISAIGVDIGIESDLEKLRYGKVVILTDADVDGQHIRTLLMTFFYRQMGKLVEQGHVFVARPPLYKVTQKKNIRYISSAEEMTQELMTRGLEGTKLAVLPLANADGTPSVGETRTFEGAALEALVKVVTPLEEALVILERRGVNLATYLPLVNAHRLPAWRMLIGGAEKWFQTEEEANTYRKQEEQRRGRELVAEDEGTGTNGSAMTFSVHELPEVRNVNRARLLEELHQRGLKATDLLPLPRVAGREPPLRFVLLNGEQKRVLPHLRDLVSEVRHLGEKGLVITRFKGLGEMDAEELWDTTLDPARRTLLRVQLDDAIKADELFRTLMGEKVEPRREFIQREALNAKDIDYHGA